MKVGGPDPVESSYKGSENMRCFKPQAIGMVLILVGLGGCQSGGGMPRWDWWRSSQKETPAPNSALAGSPYDGVKLPSQKATPEVLSDGKDKSFFGAKSSVAKTPPGTPAKNPYAVADLRPKSQSATSYPSTSYPSTTTKLVESTPASGNFRSSPEKTAQNPAAQIGPYGGNSNPGPTTRYPSTSAVAVRPENLGQPAGTSLGGPANPAAGPVNRPIGDRYASLPAAANGPRYDAPSGAVRYPVTSAAPTYQATTAVPPAYPVVGVAAPSPGISPPQASAGQRYGLPTYPSTTNPPVVAPVTNLNPPASQKSAAPAAPFRPGSTSTYVPEVGTAASTPPVNPAVPQAPYNPPARVGVGSRYGGSQ